MIAGQYVDHAGDTWQVTRIVTGAATLYELASVTRRAWTTLRNPLAVDVPLTPACGPCQTPAGFRACHATGTHPATVPAAREVAPQAPSSCVSCRTDLERADHRDWCPVLWACGCGEPLCGECMRPGARVTATSRREFVAVSASVPYVGAVAPAAPVRDPWAIPAA